MSNKMEKIDFCFNVGGSKEAAMDYEIGSRLKKHYGWNGRYIVVPGNRVLQDKKGAEIAPDFINNPSPSNKNYRKYSDYDLPGDLTFELLRFSDIILRNMPRKKSFRIIDSYLSFWNNFFDKHKDIKCVITYPTGGVIGRTAYCVAEKRGIPYLTIDSAGGVLISNINEDNANKKLIDTYQLKKKTGLSDSERKKVLSFVNAFRDKKEMIARVNRPTGNLTRRFKTLFSLLGFKNRYKWMSRTRVFKDYTKTLYKYLFIKMVTKYDKIENREKYIFFPLHVVFDMQILVRSPFYSNQAELVKSIALSLPADVKLYVKEHPANIGNTPIDQLKRIKKIANVKLLDPSLNSHNLIKNSEAVITIASTTGWEAFLYEKPVITFGRAFYVYSDLVYKVARIEKLPKLIKDVLKDTTHYDDRRLWEIFIYSVLSETSSFEKPNAYVDANYDSIKRVSDKICKLLYKTYLYSVENPNFKFKTDNIKI